MSSFKKSLSSPFTLAIKSDHVILGAIHLVTVSDLNDTLVEKAERSCYRGVCSPVEGQIFTLHDKVSKKTVLMIVPAPDYYLPRAYVDKGVFTIENGIFEVYYTECALEDCERRVRDWYRERYTPSILHTMSNTWGDRNGRTLVCDDFIRREIDSAIDLGLDVVQIDDGWQRGIPENYDEDGNRIFEGDFWELKDEIFPNGIKPLAEYAREGGAELGLWFAPHSRGDFEHFDRDLSVLKKAYDEWSVRYFKLDMIDLPGQKSVEKMTELLERLKSYDDVSVELDVTAQRRLGYLAAAPYGTIFVENRYTAWGNYYPHRTLRNEWMLSRYIPTSKLQFELINPELCREVYTSTDPYRHELYDIDYLFASVMLSNPLFWMETQFLSDRSREQLRSIIPLWKQYRKELTTADVSPIGEEPSGEALTGFLADIPDSSHLLLFRESTDRASLTVTLPFQPTAIEKLAEKSPSAVSQNGRDITVTFGAPRSYVWLKITK